MNAYAEGTPLSKSSGGAWKCKSFPELHPTLYGHLLGQSSCLGTAKWQRPDPVVGTKDWHTGMKGSIKRGTRGAGRDKWITDSDMGAIHGEPSQLPPPVFGHQPYVPKAFRGHEEIMGYPSPSGTRSSKAGSLSSSMNSSRASSVRGGGGTLRKGAAGSRRGAANGRSRTQSASSTGSSTMDRQQSSRRLAQNQSLPDILNGDLPYPPTPAFLRNFLARTYDWSAARHMSDQAEEDSDLDEA